MTALIVFDDGLGNLGPMTDLRASFEVRTGGFTTLERLEIALGMEADALFAPDGVEALVRERFDVEVNALPKASSEGASGEFLLVNGRCALAPDAVAALKVGQALIEAASGQPIAARLSRTDAASFVKSWRLAKSVKAINHDDPCLLHHAADVIWFRDRAIDFDVGAMLEREGQDLPPGVVHIGDEGVMIDPTAMVYPTVVLDAEKGPIVIAGDAVVRPGAIVCGPAFIGAGSTIIDRAHIKAHTAIGPVCKVGGEIGATIFQGFSNKGHEGHLGDSWVGEWANFGAGTTNSNLLNTYGEVSMRLSVDDAPTRTGLTFLGCIVGDHVKFAIGTRIMTGTAIGTGAMIATTAPPPFTVDRFAWLTDAGAQRYRIDKFLEVMSAVMARRECEASAAYVERVRELHAGAPAARRVERAK